MTKRQVNLLRMFIAVREALRKNESALYGDEGMLGSRDRLELFLFELNEAAKKQKVVTKGLAATTKLKEKVLCAETLMLCASLTQFGGASGDAHLTRVSDHTMASLRVLRKPELVQLVGALCDIAEPIISSLAPYPYGFGPAQLDRLRAILSDYEVALHAYRSAVAERIAATTTIKRLVGETSFLLRRGIDNMAKKYEDTTPIFYTAYAASRKTVDLGIRHDADSGGDPTAVV